MQAMETDPFGFICTTPEEAAQVLRARQDSLPDEECRVCGGTGSRQEPPQVGPGNLPCNACGGTGRVRPFETNYGFDVDTVREFAEFLRDCGGFEIW